jgi:hypothetical protein
MLPSKASVIIFSVLLFPLASSLSFALEQTYTEIHEEAISTDEMRLPTWSQKRQDRADAFCKKKSTPDHAWIRGRKFKTNRPSELKTGDNAPEKIQEALTGWLTHHPPQTFYFREITCSDLPSRHGAQSHSAPTCGGGIKSSSPVLNSKSTSCIDQSLTALNQVSVSPPRKSKVPSLVTGLSLNDAVKKSDNSPKATGRSSESGSLSDKSDLSPSKEITFNKWDDPYSIESRQLTETWKPSTARKELNYTYSPPIKSEYHKENLGFEIPNTGDALDSHKKRMNEALQGIEEKGPFEFQEFRSGSQSVVYQVAGKNYVLKVKKRQVMEKDVQLAYRLFERDVALGKLLKETASRFVVQKEGKDHTPIRPVEYDLRPSLLKQGIVKQEYFSGPTAFEVAELVRKAQAKDAQAIQTLKQNHLTIEKADLELSWLESFYRETHPYVLAFHENNDLEKVGNQIVLNEKFSDHVGFDGNKGKNAVWDAVNQVWRLIDW